MFWIILLTSSVAFGFTILQYIRFDRFPFCFYFSLSWLFGSMLTSMLIYILHFILPFNAFFVMLIIAMQCSIIYYIRKFLKENRKPDYLSISLIRFENTFGLYFLLFIVSSITLIHLFFCFYQFPKSIPKEANDFVDIEMSFISSVRYGINKRRSNIFFYKDPLNFNDYFSKPSLPFLYSAALNAFGLNYAESSIIICFLNTLCTAIFIYHYSFFFSRRPFLTSICFMFNGGLSFFRIMFGNKCRDNDYMRNICFSTPVPWYSMIGTLMTFSKEFSFALPLSLVAILFAQYPKKKNVVRQYYLIAGIAITLNPSVGSSTCIFLVCSCFSKSFKYIMPFVLTLLPKLANVYFHNFPIWREYQMYGVFYACLVVWFDQLGPMFISMFLPVPAIEDNITIHRHLAFTSGFLLINLFRFGNSNFENIIAIMTVILPMICIYFVGDLFFIVKIFHKNQLCQGIFTGISIFIYVTFVIGGIASIFIISSTNTNFLNSDDIECGKWIRKNIKRYELIVTDPFSNNPCPLIAGNQILCGDMNMLWRSGSNVTRSLQYIRQIEINKNLINIMEKIGSNYLMVSEESIFSNIIRNQKNFFTYVYENQKWIIYKRKDRK